MDTLLLEQSTFHNPQLKLIDQIKQQKILDLLKGLVLTETKLRKVMGLFKEEMNLGLIANPPRKSVFYMCNTFVTDIPDGTEEGYYVGMDLGGSNLRIHLARLKKGTEPQFISEPYEIDAKHRRGKPEELFDFLAECLEDFINKIPELNGKRVPFGFTFSFGYDQKALDIGIIKEFSLSTDIPEAIGKDAVQYFRDAIARRGLNIDVIAILNDTTSTLAYGMYLKPDAQIGFVLGSGTNTCYLESVDRMKNIDPMKTFGKKVENVIINCENGFLGDNGSIDYVKTDWDKQNDAESGFPGSYGFEKVIGGMFMGELLRKIFITLAQNKVFLNGIIRDELKTKDSIRGPDLSEVEKESGDGPVLTLLKRLGYTSDQITSDDIAIVKYVCARISVRNAQLAAADISAVAQHIGKPLVRVAMDGSVYKKHPKMHTLIADFINELVVNQKVEIFLAEDGSGKGSAFIAAVAQKLKQKS